MVTVTSQQILEVINNIPINCDNILRYVFLNSGLYYYSDRFINEEIDIQTLSIMDDNDFVELGVNNTDLETMKNISYYFPYNN